MWSELALKIEPDLDFVWIQNWLLSLKTGSGHRNVPVVRISSDDHRAGCGFRTRSDIAIDGFPHAFAICSCELSLSCCWALISDHTQQTAPMIGVR